MSEAEEVSGAGYTRWTGVKGFDLKRTVLTDDSLDALRFSSGGFFAFKDLPREISFELEVSFCSAVSEEEIIVPDPADPRRRAYVLRPSCMLPRRHLDSHNDLMGHVWTNLEGLKELWNGA